MDSSRKDKEIVSDDGWVSDDAESFDFHRLLMAMDNPRYVDASMASSHHGHLFSILLTASFTAYVLWRVFIGKPESKESQMRARRLQALENGSTGPKQKGEPSKRDPACCGSTKSTLKKRKKKIRLPKPARFLPKLTKEELEQKADDALEPVASDGVTVFRHIPHLPNQEMAAQRMKRIAKEFLPIIRNRGYDVISVSEWCCCGDGIDAELGGHLRRIQEGQRIQGHEQDDCLGYNRTEYMQRSGRRVTAHRIHLRLRHSQDHSRFYSYYDLAETMAHEMAHCVFQHHKDDFWKLMQEIREEHSEFVRTGNLTSGPAPAAFDVYGSSVATAHGQS